MKNFNEFIEDLKNCKDIQELLDCLSSEDAFSNYTICLIKRDDNQDGFNEHFKKQIELNNFLTQWIEFNEGYFIEDSITYLIDLIRVTHKYLSDKYSKNFLTIIQKTEHTQRLNNAKKYQTSVQKHLKAVKRDLEEIFPKGTKTTILLKSIDEALNDMDSIVPIVETPTANTKELKKYLTYLENETDILKASTREYIDFFKHYNSVQFADDFRFFPTLTHITS